MGRFWRGEWGSCSVACGGRVFFVSFLGFLDGIGLDGMGLDGMGWDWMGWGGISMYIFGGGYGAFLR